MAAVPESSTRAATVPGRAPQADPSGPVVETTAGRLQGAERRGEHGGVRSFLGIPYAAPPVGPLRFRPPEPPAAWAGVRRATAFGARAEQPPMILEQLMGATAYPTSEDCLTLNVWTPACDDARRPVMVWIHGGAFLYGSGSVPWYDGTRFAAGGDVVVVTINYRLGAFGFLALDELAGERYAGSGNAGLLDQVAALRWVRDNVEAFGGDPGNVTVFGESAGAISVALLLAAPGARGLFHHAIVQSGATTFVVEQTRATEIAGRVLHTLGVDPTDPAQLAAVPADRILEVQQSFGGSSSAGLAPFRPVLDGRVLPRSPLRAIADGHADGIDLIVGTTADEMSLFTLLDPTLEQLDDAGLATLLDAQLGPGEGARLVAGYRAPRPDAPARDLFVAMASDMVFRIPALHLADAQARHAPVYVYRFTWPTPALDGRLGACHALELPFVFDNLDAPGVPFLCGPDPEPSLAPAMHRAWIAFARSGDPNHPGLPRWEPHDPTRRPTMRFDATCSLELDPLGSERALWDGITEEALRVQATFA